MEPAQRPQQNRPTQRDASTRRDAFGQRRNETRTQAAPGTNLESRKKPDAEGHVTRDAIYKKGPSQASA